MKTLFTVFVIALAVVAMAKEVGGKKAGPGLRKYKQQPLKAKHPVAVPTPAVKK